MNNNSIGSDIAAKDTGFVASIGQHNRPVTTETSGTSETAIIQPEPAEKNLSENPYIFVPEDRSRAEVELIYALEGEAGHEVTDRLEIRRPTVNDSIIAEKLAEGDNNQLFVARLANICEVSHEAMESLDELEDMEALIEAYGLLGSYEGDAAGNPMINMTDNRKSVCVKLHYPVEFGVDDEEKPKFITELNMRRPKLRDSTEAEAKSKWPTEILMYKYAALCSVNIEVIKKLDDIDDFSSLDQAFGFFRRAKINRRKQR